MIWIMGLKGKKPYLFWESLSYSVFSLACASVIAVTSVPVQRGNPRMVHPLGNEAPCCPLLGLVQKRVVWDCQGPAGQEGWSVEGGRGDNVTDA